MHEDQKLHFIASLLCTTAGLLVLVFLCIFVVPERRIEYVDDTYNGVVMQIGIADHSVDMPVVNIDDVYVNTRLIYFDNDQTQRTIWASYQCIDQLTASTYVSDHPVDSSLDFWLTKDNKAYLTEHHSYYTKGGLTDGVLVILSISLVWILVCFSASLVLRQKYTQSLRFESLVDSDDDIHIEENSDTDDDIYIEEEGKSLEMVAIA